MHRWNQQKMTNDNEISQPFEILVASERHRQILGEVIADLNQPSGNLFFDIRTAALMREHGVLEI